MGKNFNWRNRASIWIAAAAVGAFAVAAAPLPAFAETGTVTISQKANADATYDAYRLFKAAIDGENSATGITWDDSVNAQLTSLVNLLDDNGYTAWLAEREIDTDDDSKKSSQNALEFISSKIASSDGDITDGYKVPNASSFAGKLATWVKSNLQKVGTASQGQAFTADEGYYLFLSSEENLGGSDVATAPIWFPLGGSSTMIDEKAVPAIIEKQVKEDSDSAWKDFADAEIGQEVEYKIDVTIPGNYGAFETFYAGVTDALPKGMTLVGSEEDAWGVKVKVGETEVTSKFTIAYDNTTKKLTVVNENTKSAANGVPEIKAGSTVSITYKAKLVEINEGDIVFGGEGNKNTAKFEFSNNPFAGTKGTTEEVDAKLHTFMLAIDKTDEATSQELAGAEFVIKNQEGKFLENGAWTADTQTDAQVFQTDERGEISGIKGLDATPEGTKYTIIEVTPPKGYELPSNPSFELTLTPTYNEVGNLTGLTGTVKGAIATIDNGATDANAGTIGVDVKNTKALGLAVTGGTGAAIGGVAVLAVGLGWYVARTNRRKAAGADAE